MRPTPILLMEAAGREFGQKGFAGASFREIAEAAGLSFALIGYHFGSKEELWNSCLEYFGSIAMDALKAYRREMPASRAAFGEWLREFLRTGLLLVLENPVLWRISMHAALSNVTSRDGVVLPANDLFVKEEERTLAGASRVITRFTPREVQFLYRAILHMHVANPYELELMTGYPHRSAESLEHHVEFLVSLLCKGKGLGTTSRRRAVKKTSPSSVPVAARGERSPHFSDSRLLKGEKVRERLVEAASKNFALYGFEGTSVRMIAKDANVTYPLVIYHFGSKELLWQVAIEKMFDQRMETVHGLSANFEVNNASQMREMIVLLLKGATTRPELRKIALLEQFAGSRRYEEILKPMGAEATSAMSTLTQRLVDKKIVSRFSASETQLLLVSAILYSSVLPQVVKLVLGTKTTEQSIDWIADFLVTLLTTGHGLQ